jgi:hypothetical protein
MIRQRGRASGVAFGKYIQAKLLLFESHRGTLVSIHPIDCFAELYHMSLVVVWQVAAGDLLISFGLLDLTVKQACFSGSKL